MTRESILGPSELKFSRKSKSVEEAKKETTELANVEVPDLFDNIEIKPGKNREYRSDGTDKHAREINLFQLEWAIKYPHMSPRQYLTDIKEMSQSATERMLERSGGVQAWGASRADIVDKMTETTVRRHMELIEATQKIHIDAARMGVDKAVEYLDAMQARDPETNEPTKRFSGDLLNIMSAVEKAQSIYRKAVGISDDTDVSKLINVFQNNVQINSDSSVSITTVPKEFSEMDYDDIKMLIKLKKERMDPVVVDKKEEDSNNP